MEPQIVAFRPNSGIYLFGGLGKKPHDATVRGSVWGEKEVEVSSSNLEISIVI